MNNIFYNKYKDLFDEQTPYENNWKKYDNIFKEKNNTFKNSALNSLQLYNDKYKNNFNIEKENISHVKNSNRINYNNKIIDRSENYKKQINNNPVLNYKKQINNSPTLNFDKQINNSPILNFNNQISKNIDIKYDEVINKKSINNNNFKNTESKYKPDYNKELITTNKYEDNYANKNIKYKNIEKSLLNEYFDSYKKNQNVYHNNKSNNQKNNFNIFDNPPVNDIPKNIVKKQDTEENLERTKTDYNKLIRQEKHKNNFEINKIFLETLYENSLRFMTNQDYLAHLKSCIDKRIYEKTKLKNKVKNLINILNN